MSKLSMLICWAIVAFIVAVFAARASAQAIEATIDVTALPSSKVGIAGSFVNKQENRRHLSFLRSVAGIEGLPNRISDIRLLDAENTSVSFKQLAPGEYLAERDFTHWSYTVDVSPDKNPHAAAHVSWSANGTAILMLMDLMPVGKAGQRAAMIRFKTPTSFDQYGLPVYPSQATRGGVFNIADTDEAVFYIGGGWDAISLSDPFTAGDAILACCGWNFEPVDVSTNAKEIYSFYQKMFRSDSLGRPMIAVAKFPQKMEFGRWEAETRGTNVTIVTSDMPFKQQSVQRLHEQLRHELFHLWIPNGVNLTGNYDWFYEGFALYQSLKMAVGMNRITFNDFLDTLSRAHTIDSARSQSISLVDASKARFSGANTQVYARGMLVAFLTDLALLERSSKGDRSVETLLRELYSEHKKPSTAEDGNKVVIALLNSNPELRPIVLKYVTGTDKLDWTNQLAAAGISDSDPGPITTLKVSEKLSGRQKTMLDKLGYNNWRKLSPSSK